MHTTNRDPRKGTAIVKRNYDVECSDCHRVIPAGEEHVEDFIIVCEQCDDRLGADEEHTAAANPPVEAQMDLTETIVTAMAKMASLATRMDNRLGVLRALALLQNAVGKDVTPDDVLSVLSEVAESLELSSTDGDTIDGFDHTPQVLGSNEVTTLLEHLSVVEAVARAADRAADTPVMRATLGLALGPGWWRVGGLHPALQSVESDSVCGAAILELCLRAEQLLATPNLEDDVVNAIWNATCLQASVWWFG